MFTKTIKLTEKGQIAIPREVRRRAGLVAGEMLIIAEKDGRILIERADKRTHSLEDEFKAWDAASDEALMNFEKTL